MHGLINKTLQGFVTDTYGRELWIAAAEQVQMDSPEIEAMLHYPDDLTFDLLAALSSKLDKDQDSLLEDIGTYLVSHPNVERLRRLLRFGGVTFVEFLHSLDDLPDRARLAVSDLEIPSLELREFESNKFSLICDGEFPGFGHVLVGVLRSMADDYGSLAILEHATGTTTSEIIEITLADEAFSEGRSFSLGGASNVHGEVH